MQSVKDEKGFTLIEIIMVIVILGVIGAVGGDLISEVFRGFNVTRTRLELYEEGKSVLARMEREFHGMLPNGACVTNDGGVSCESDGSSGNEIQFGMIGEDTMRINELVGGYVETALQFPRTAPATLTESNPAGIITVGDLVSIYNTDWSSFATGTRLFQVTSVTTNLMTFAGQTISTPSPQNRYYLVDRGVRYRWDDTEQILYRSVDSVGAGGVGDFSSAVEYPLATDVGDFNFYYMAPSLSRNGIISIVFTMVKGGHNIVMHKEFHVKNVP